MSETLHNMREGCGGSTVPVQGTGGGSTPALSLHLIPITFAQARDFIKQHHRHNPNVKAGWKFGVGVADQNGNLVGVAMAGLPAARMAMKEGVVEVNRTCTDGSPNANSILYAAIVRAAAALGYSKLITYTLPSESGASLKAAGWQIENENAGSEKSWLEARGTGTNDFLPDGTRVRVAGRKIRWCKVFQRPRGQVA